MRNGKKHSHNNFSYNYLGSPTQADPTQEDDNIQAYFV